MKGSIIFIFQKNENNNFEINWLHENRSRLVDSCLMWGGFLLFILGIVGYFVSFSRGLPFPLLEFVCLGIYCFIMRGVRYKFDSYFKKIRHADTATLAVQFIVTNLLVFYAYQIVRTTQIGYFLLVLGFVVSFVSLISIYKLKYETKLIGFFLILVYTSMLFVNGDFLIYSVGQLIVISGLMFHAYILHRHYFYPAHSSNENNEFINPQGDENLDLLRIICHDISNPLFAITGYLGIVRQIEDIKHPMYIKSMDKIEKSTVLMGDIIENAREINALRRGSRQINLEGIDLANYCQETIDSFAEVLEDKKIEIDLIDHLKDGVMPIADASTLSKHVLPKLFSNAIKFSEKDSKVTVEISENENSIELSIMDCGIGIPKEIIDHIFVISKTTSRLGTNGEHGTGFGLNIVSQYMDLYGAKISVESRDIADYPDDHWTSFKINFLKYEP